MTGVGGRAALAAATFVLTVIGGGSAAAGPAVAAPAPLAGCTAAGYRQFDFWAGTWDVFDFGGADKVAIATITPIQDGCGLREQYRQVDGHGGESLNLYDPAADVWRQAWVSNRGQALVLEGRLHDGVITLTGPEYGGPPGRMVRGRWAPYQGGVREIGERSVDGGRTWTPWFDILFRRSTAGSALMVPEEPSVSRAPPAPR